MHRLWKFLPLNTHRFLAFPLPLLGVEVVGAAGFDDFWLLSDSPPNKFERLIRQSQHRVITWEKIAAPANIQVLE